MGRSTELNSSSFFEVSPKGHSAHLHARARNPPPMPFALDYVDMGMTISKEDADELIEEFDENKGE